MKSDWVEISLGEITSAPHGSIKSGPFGTVLKASEYSPDGVPLISVGEVGEGSLRVHAKTPRVGREVVERLGQYLLRADDIVIARKGAIDRSARVKATEEGYFLGTDGLRVRLPNSVSARYIAYQFLDPRVRAWLRQHAGGSTMPSMNQSILERVPLLLPPLDEQRRIAGVLGALDNLIEVNRRLMFGIEELLSARFAELGFDEPGDALLGDLIEINPVRAKPKGNAAYIDMAALSETQAGIDRVGRRPAIGGARFINGDTVMARITPCLENGKIGYIDCLQDGEIGVGSTEFIVLRSPSPFPLPWSYILARSPRFRDHVVRHMTGTSGRQRCPADAVVGYMIKSPRPDDLKAFGELANPLFESLRELRNENQTLSATRDELLPLLMSGRVRVAEIVAA